MKKENVTNLYFIIGIVLAIGIVVWAIYDVFFTTSPNVYLRIFLFFLAILVISTYMFYIVDYFFPKFSHFSYFLKSEKICRNTI